MIQQLVSTDRIALGAAALIAAVLAYLVVIAVYRWTLHPLSKYPGPWLTKLTAWPTAVDSFKGRLHLKLYHDHQKWGPVVRAGPNRLVFSSVAALQQIYFSKDIQKSTAAYWGVSSTTARNTFTLVDKPEHRRRRKVLGQAFSEQALKAVEPMFSEHSDRFIRSLCPDTGEGWSKPQDLANLGQYLTLDIISAFGFGQSLNTQTDSANWFMPSAIEGPALINGIYYNVPSLVKFNLEPKLCALGLAPRWTRNELAKVVRGLVASRTAMGKDAVHDLYSLLLDAKDPDTGEGLSIRDIWAEGRLFLVAGTDTTATTLAATFFYLSRNPACYERLKAEVRSAFDSPADICIGPVMNGCTYLRACIDEALRMAPPVSAPLWREVSNPDGVLIDGHYVPAGTELGVSLYVTHHNPEIFPDPFTYVPDRWLPPTTPAALEQMNKAFRPFSLGARRCIAQSMAYLELTTTVAKAIWYLEMKRPDGPLDLVGGGKPDGEPGRTRPGEYQLYDHFVAARDGPYLQFRPREGFEEKVLALGA